MTLARGVRVRLRQHPERDGRVEHVFTDGVRVAWRMRDWPALVQANDLEVETDGGSQS